MPTAREMRKFSEQFTEREWQILCYEQKFLTMFGEDLKAAQKFANETLAPYRKNFKNSVVFNTHCNWQTK